MKTYTPPTLQLIKLRPAQTLLSLSGTHDEVGNEGQSGNLRLYLLPHFGKDGSIFCVGSAQTMHPHAHITKVFWFGFD